MDCETRDEEVFESLPCSDVQDAVMNDEISIIPNKMYLLMCVIFLPFNVLGEGRKTVRFFVPL